MRIEVSELIQTVSYSHREADFDDEDEIHDDWRDRKIAVTGRFSFLSESDVCVLCIFKMNERYPLCMAMK